MEQLTAQKPNAYAPPASTMCRLVRSFSVLANIGEDSRLHASREKRIAPYTSTPMLAELSDTLARRKFVRRIDETGRRGQCRCAGSCLGVDRTNDHKGQQGKELAMLLGHIAADTREGVRDVIRGQTT